MNHIVKQDDSLQRIAAFYYGDWTLYTLIREANLGLIPDEFDLVSGTRLEIPMPSFEDSTHVVALGDSYQSISVLYFKTEHFSHRISVANNDLILSENLGVEILIPALVDFDKFKKARERLSE